MLPLLLGESPSKSGDRYYAFPLSGLVARTLCRAAGLEPPSDASGIGGWYWELREHFDTHNVFERYRDATPWSVPKAREHWARYLLTRPKEEQEQELVVVCLGVRVAQAVGHDRPFGVWFEAGLLQVVMAPHPSGLNRMLNDPVNREMLGRIMNEARVRARAGNAVH